MYVGRRMTVVFDVAGNARVVTGWVNSDMDRDLGSVRRVERERNGDDSAGQTTLILQEKLLQNRLAVDNRYDCDWCLDLGHVPAHHEDRRAHGSPEDRTMVRHLG